ncbi:hemerythrin HHE cation-binding domain protein isoform X2 [Wolffia australiana]
MGNCTPKPAKARAPPPPPPAAKERVILYGPEGSLDVSLVKIGLLYKNLAVEFYAASDGPVLESNGEKVSGAPARILRYADEKFAGPAVAPAAPPAGAVAIAAALQHRSMERHLERMVKWGEEMVNGGVNCRGSPKLEMKRFGRGYGQLMEMMMEHARMEERVVFPAMDRVDPELCRSANEEHAKELPMMNGIKEYLKSIFVLENGGAAHREALLNLCHRLRVLQVHCTEHFAEEERDVFPLLEEIVTEEPQSLRPAPDELVEAMEATHGHLFSFFLSGLLPHETMQYLDVLCRCQDRNRISVMLRTVEIRLEDSGGIAIILMCIVKGDCH